MKTLAFLFILVTSAIAAEPPASATTAQVLRIARLTIGTYTYQNAAIQKIDELFARVTHDAGTSRIPCDKLPADIATKLGFDLAKAKAVALELKAEEEAQAARIVAASEKAKELSKNIPPPDTVKTFWVEENREEGLVVGIFDRVPDRAQYIRSSSSRTGGGGGIAITGGTHLEKSYSYAFIPHTAETQTLTDNQNFTAAILSEGTYRLDESTVIPKFKLIRIESKAENGVKTGVNSP